MVVGADLAGQLDDPADYGAGIPYGPSRKNPALSFCTSLQIRLPLTTEPTQRDL